MTPDEAGKKLDDRKPAEENPSQWKTSKKRGANQITPQQGPELKRIKYPLSAAGSATAGPHTSYAEAASSTKVAVMPRDPEASLSAEELTALEEAIVQMLLGFEIKLKFAGIHSRPGMLAVDAVDKHSAEWLIYKVPQLVKWSER